MLAAATAALEYGGSLGSIAELQADRRTRDAILHNLFVLGEAAKAVPLEVRERHPEIEWRSMTGLRDIIGHEYSGLDDEIVWDIVKTELPRLIEQLQPVLRAEEDD
jgi:uncharacterized protein with HEPN domain